jgi:hypothetical protein
MAAPIFQTPQAQQPVHNPADYTTVPVVQKTKSRTAGFLAQGGVPARINFDALINLNK